MKVGQIVLAVIAIAVVAALASARESGGGIGNAQRGQPYFHDEFDDVMRPHGFGIDWARRDAMLPKPYDHGGEGREGGGILDRFFGGESRRQGQR